MKTFDLAVDNIRLRWCPDRGYPFTEPFQKFYDSRGSIINLAEGAFKDIAVIRSVPGARRAGHYHKEDWHLICLLSGEFIYKYRYSGIKGEMNESRVSQGDTIFTPPGIFHTLEFIEPSLMLVVSKNPRSTSVYEKDTFRSHE